MGIVAIKSRRSLKKATITELQRLVLLKQLEISKEIKELKEKEMAVLQEIKLSIDKLSANDVSV